MQQIYRRIPMAKCDFNKVDFVPFAQFKKHEIYPWRSVTFI